MKSEYGLTQVFKYDGNEYEIQFDVHYDVLKCWATLTKIEAWGLEVYITAAVYKAAQEIAQEAAEQEWLGLIENANELE